MASVRASNSGRVSTASVPVVHAMKVGELLRRFTCVVLSKPALDRVRRRV